MRFWLDTEFIDDGKTIDLISIGIVREDGFEYYAQSCEFDHRKASEWVKENVLAHLPMCPWAQVSVDGIPSLYRTDKAYHKRYGQCVDQQRGLIHNCPWRTRSQITSEILAFMDIEKYGKPEIYGWCSGYDWVAFCQLFGTMMDLPSGYPHYMRDIQQVLDAEGITDDMLPQQQGQAHNALEDAKYIQLLWATLGK